MIILNYKLRIYMLGEKIYQVFKNKKILNSTFKSGLNIILILLALNLITNNLIITDSLIMLVSTTFVLIVITILNLQHIELYKIYIKKNKEKKSLYIIITGLILILLSYILLLSTKIQLLWLISIPILLSGLNLTIQGAKIKRKELHLLSVVSFIYVVFYIFVQTISVLWYYIQQFSLFTSKIIGSITLEPLLLGPSTSGLWIVIIFLIFSCCVFFLSQGKKRNFIFNIIGLAICWITYLVILSYVDFKSKDDVLNLHYILFLFCLVPTFIYLHRNKIKDEPTDILRFKNIKLKRIIKNGAVWSLTLLFISSIVLTVFFGANSNNFVNPKKNILFYGQNMLGTWDTPEYGKYGQTASGMFGLLPLYLNNSGYNVKIIVNDKEEFLNSTLSMYENVTRYVNLTNYTTIIESKTINSDILKDNDIFTVINLNTTFSIIEYEAIWDFVEKGGSLLVLGDHTDVGGMMNPLNHLLKPVGISFKFDDALPMDSNFNWIPCYQLTNNPITYKINSLDEVQIGVGASLDISANSFPVIIGRYGLSDNGNLLNVKMAYLGDYEYNKGEQIGDIILAASTYYGNGKVLVFGDTSSFQNIAIINSYPLINSVFSWLSSHRTASIQIAQIGTALILLAGAFIIFLLFKNDKIHFILFPLVLCVALLISVTVNPMILHNEKIKGDLVYVDASHVERFNLESYNDNSLTGLELNLMRNNYLPLLLRDYDQDEVKNCDILIFNAPTKSFSNDEVEFLKQYIQNGGLVILATGYQDKDASMPLLREFGLDIYDLPLGPVPYTEVNQTDEYEEQPRFVNSWPIATKENDNTEVFYSFNISEETYILMTLTKYGNGGLLLIADSEFLVDKNIESISDYWPGNIIFLKNILDELHSKGILK